MKDSKENISMNIQGHTQLLIEFTDPKINFVSHISSRSMDDCQEFSPTLYSDTEQAGFKHVQNLRWMKTCGSNSH